MKAKKSKKGVVRIVILQRGWVVIGRDIGPQKDGRIELTNPSVIRIWGTSGLSGLPYLAGNGPVSGKTVLDKSSCSFRYHPLTEVLVLDCKESKWTNYL